MKLLLTQAALIGLAIGCLCRFKALDREMQTMHDALYQSGNGLPSMFNPPKPAIPEPENGLRLRFRANSLPDSSPEPQGHSAPIWTQPDTGTIHI